MIAVAISSHTPLMEYPGTKFSKNYNLRPKTSCTWTASLEYGVCSLIIHGLQFSSVSSTTLIFM